MQFNSIEFAIFLPLVFLIYWNLRRSIKSQNIFVVFASYIFYGWWNWKLLFLIAFTSFLSWSCGILIEQYKNKNHLKRAKWISGINICINLGILALFKYYNFFIDNFIGAFQILGFSLHRISLQLILPVGISFYTFQALSYTIDIYQGKIKPTKDIVAFFAYVSFFPQLVAGPIERATNLLPQFLKSRSFNYNKSVDGMRQILWGLFKKIVIADNCAGMVNIIFDNYQNAGWQVLILGAFLFTFQIYGDFSGYSDIAIGTAKLFGFDLMTNFRNPYFSSNIPEFWRRWHISLNTWFRDYVYIPLGGNRCSKTKHIRNTLIVFGLSGLWHGANWTYILWGLFHGLLTIPYALNKKIRYKRYNIINIILTFILVVIGWIIFRAENINQAFDYIGGILSLSKGNSDLGLSIVTLYTTIVFIISLLTIEYLQRNNAHTLELNGIHSRIVRWNIYLFLIFLILLFPGQAETFIYFQF